MKYYCNNAVGMQNMIVLNSRDRQGIIRLPKRKFLLKLPKCALQVNLLYFKFLS